MLLLLCGALLRTAKAQPDSAEFFFNQFRAQLDKEFRDSSDSPLPAGEYASFGGHTFFNYDPAFRVMARVQKLDNPERFLMATTTNRQPEYLKMFRLTFTIRDTACILYLYQNIAYASKPGNGDHLFLPFCDRTNGFDSYGGGRYIDLQATEAGFMLIDFNLSYNPYCAYNKKYSCPVPPRENHLPVSIFAGIKSPIH